MAWGTLRWNWFRFYFPFPNFIFHSGVQAEYIEEFVDDVDILPVFPIARPAEFQIFESDCRINSMLITQLKQKFFETPAIEMETFVVNNLEKMLTNETASLFSWNGQQGYLPVMHFRTMKTLIGSLVLWFMKSPRIYLRSSTNGRLITFQIAAGNYTIRIREQWVKWSKDGSWRPKIRHDANIDE